MPGSLTLARPFQELAIDLHNFYTDWHDIIHMGHDTTDSLPWDTGAPNIIWSDQFILSKEWGFWHITSTPTYLCTHRTMGRPRLWWKIFLEQYGQAYVHPDAGKLACALLQYRKGLAKYISPAQKLFGQPAQDSLPAHHRSFALEWQHSAKEANEQERSHTDSEQVEHYYNQHVRMCPPWHLQYYGYARC